MKMGTNAVPVEQWGKDHWSTFAYIACVVTGRKGEPDKDRMRTDKDLHPGLLGRQVSLLGSDKKYPTILKGDIELPNHDDWNCAEDLEAVGLIKWNGTGIHPIFELTECGWKIFKDLTAFKNNGGTFATFVCPIELGV
jgi:hypothetical protein